MTHPVKKEYDSERGDRPVIVVEGGDGKADDIEAIQEAIDRASGHRRPGLPEPVLSLP